MVQRNEWNDRMVMEDRRVLCEKSWRHKAYRMISLWNDLFAPTHLSLQLARVQRNRQK